jgi:hypothetical protein
VLKKGDHNSKGVGRGSNRGSDGKWQSKTPEEQLHTVPLPHDREQIKQLVTRRGRVTEQVDLANGD